VDVLDFLLHLDRYLAGWSQDMGGWFYVLLFAVIFAETGLVFIPFLPGDSVLVAVGTIAATPGSGLDPWLAAGVMMAAAIIGDSTNYWVGRWLGPRLFASETSRLLNKNHVKKAQAFYERHGGKTVIFCRFLAVIRTFAPFVAGMGAMNYRKFVSYSVFGTVLWVGIFLPLGYWLASRFPEAPKYVMYGIILFAVVPPTVSHLRDRAARRRAAAVPSSDRA
jgi:membrane-associated protein